MCFGDPEKRVVDFPYERDTFRNKNMEIAADFVEKKLTTTTVKPWKPSRIFRVNPNFFIFLFFLDSLFHFSHFLISQCSFVFSEKKKVSSFLLSCISFKKNFIAGVSIRV